MYYLDEKRKTNTKVSKILGLYIGLEGAVVALPYRHLSPNGPVDLSLSLRYNDADKSLPDTDVWQIGDVSMGRLAVLAHRPSSSQQKSSKPKDLSAQEQRTKSGKYVKQLPALRG